MKIKMVRDVSETFDEKNWGFVDRYFIPTCQE